ncbi:MAG: hypothetical protein RDU76_02800 [Candidatus Edwardsbacteria bacterium]|nr:hypothetical protein [Candidatus Edwardsbacteria bacterium]
MKKTMMAMMILAGLTLLVGILSKGGILPNEFLDIRHHTYIDLAQLFLIAGLAFGVYGKKNQ